MSGPGRAAEGRPRRLAASVLLCFATAGCTPLDPGGSVTTEPATYATALEDGTNTARDAEGLDELQPSTCATAAAQARAEALVGAPELTHAPLTDVIETCAVSTAAENLSRASAPAQEVVDAWMQSPGHRANILDPALTELGVACVEDDGALLCSAVFLGP